jgi:hypothetical protein
LLSNILNLFLRAPKALWTVTLREECLRLKSSLWFWGRFEPNSLKWYLVARNGGKNPGLTTYPASTR